MSFNRYYQDELIALRESGLDFARRNPALAPFLGTPGRDPDVERVLEGFSFLSGRLRQKLDDEFPEITHTLFNLLWPNYLRPVPSCSIVRYEPAANLSGSLNIPRGSRVESIPVDGTPCVYRTAFDTEVLPLRLIEQRVFEKGGQAVLALRFSILNGMLKTVPLERLRFFLTGEKVIAHTLYFNLATKVREVRFVVRDKLLEEHVTARLAPDMIRTVGFKEEEGLFPYPANTFSGYRILQESFCFPEKFMFVELSGLGEGVTNARLKGLADAKEFELQFVLTEFPPQYESFKLENWQIFCTPVVNLFNMDATPLRVDQHQSEYRIVPDPKRPYHFSTYSVDHVASWHHAKKSEHRYVLFESFEHDTDQDDILAYYRLRVRTSMYDGDIETYLALVQAEKHALPQETLSLELTCTNRQLPRQLGVGDIHVNADNTPDAVTFKNITPVTPAYAPPLEGDLLWRLLSNMSLNYISITSIQALRAVITAYDFKARHDRQRERVLEKNLRGMVRVQSEETDRIYRGMPLRGAHTRLTLDERCFSCEGDMYLFSSVLNEFLALYATVNSFHQLTVVEEKSGGQYQWPARLGSTLSL